MSEKTAKLHELREGIAQFAEKDFSEFTADDREKWAQMNSEAKTLADEVRDEQLFEKQNLSQYMRKKQSQRKHLENK